MAETGVVAARALTDFVSLGVLASRVPRDAVDDAVTATGKGARRRGGKLPPHVVVYLVMALALFGDEDYEEVTGRLTGALRSWGSWDRRWEPPTKGAVTQARQRLGPEPVAELFSQVAEPVAGLEADGAFLGPWRLMSVDGTELDVPGHAGEPGGLRHRGERRPVPEGPAGHGLRVRVAGPGAGRDGPVGRQGQRRAVPGQ